MSKKHKHISRIDSGSTHCWLHRRVINNKTVSKTFTDGVYGGKMKAKRAAIAHDKKLDREHEPFDRTGINLPIGKKANINNTYSEIAGVCLVTRKKRVGNKKHEILAWVATWREVGKKCSKSFSVIRHGYEVARNKAVKRRRLEMARLLASGKKLRPSSQVSG